MIPRDFHDCLCERPTLVGVGNLFCGDDGFGPLVVQRLRGRTSLALLDGGSAPENITGPLRRSASAKIVVLDAIVIDGKEGGSVHWIDAEQLEMVSDSTHGPSLDLFVRFVREELAADVHILGVTPMQLGFGVAMSAAVRDVAEEVAEAVIAAAPQSSA